MTHLMYKQFFTKYGLKDETFLCITSNSVVAAVFFRWNISVKFRWNISVIFRWDILVSETFWSFVSPLYQHLPVTVFLAYIFKHSDRNG